MDSDNDNSAKENATAKKPKTTQRQYSLITSFMQGIDEQLMTKESYDQQWDDLAVELNKIGPPVRDSCEWRRVWLVHKYNRKRRDSTTENLRSKRRSHQDQSITDRSSRTSEGQVPVDTMSDRNQFALSVEKLNEILRILINSNDLLKKLVASLSTK